MKSSIALFSLAGSLTVSAELLVYEPFDYAPVNDETFGQVAGKNGGVGFGGAWLDGTTGSNGGAAFVYHTQGNPESLYGGSFGGGFPNWDGVVDNLPTRGSYAGLSDWSNQGAGLDRLNSHRPLAQSAGAMAGGDGVLWLSAVWHFQTNSFFAPVGIAFTSGGASFVERARTLSNSGNGIGVGNGAVLGVNDLTPTFWAGGSESAQTNGTNISTSKDNIVILKFEFGATDTVSAWSFTEDQAMTEAAFNTSAVSATSAIDENTLTTLAFSTIRRENAVDEFRIGDTFDDVTTGLIGEERQPLEITDIIYDEGSDQITLTWKSNPGESYGVYWSEEVTGFVPGVGLDPAIPAHATGNTTAYGPFANPKPGARKLFLTVGLPDLEPPTLDRAWGNNSTISLDFSEAMYDVTGTNPANYSVVKNGGGAVVVSSVSYDPGPDTLVLTTATPLDLDADYTVTMNNLTDIAGRPLGNPTVGNFRTWDSDPAGVKVFVLAGQSNMVGYGQSETGNGGVAGAMGSLRYQVDNDTANYGHLVDGNDDWIARSDVKVWWDKAQPGGGANVVKGDLDIGFASAGDRIGPEYGFGWVMGDYFTEPVLIIKTAWGGKSLYGDFRPPSAVAVRGGQPGPYYVEMFEQVHEVLDSLGTEFPEWATSGYQIAGFGWHQGWNDAGQFTAPEYEANLVDLINDIRDEFGDPSLPVSIANTGIGGAGQSNPDRLTILNAQLAVGNPALYPEFSGTVFSADTRPFWREVSQSPANQGFHWNQNGETYFLIGDAMGQGMEGLLTP